MIINGGSKTGEPEPAFLMQMMQRVWEIYRQAVFVKLEWITLIRELGILYIGSEKP